MQKHFRDEFAFFPKTWILPQDANDLKQQFNPKGSKKCKTFIIKPTHMCQGRGIYLIRRYEDIDNKHQDNLVAQRYMAKPYLIDGLKFDLRIYVLVLGVDPLRIFMFKEGLARFATHEYVGPTKQNLENLFMHLTNYAINRKSDAFVKNADEDDDSGHKRSLSSVL
jgi:tubulin polyglutamylase TTLL6/13